jgi:ABC-type bacteriocin/lantibiotic exporter with double-glycine peptidase domain
MIMVIFCNDINLLLFPIGISICYYLNLILLTSILHQKVREISSESTYNSKMDSLTLQKPSA